MSRSLIFFSFVFCFSFVFVFVPNLSRSLFFFLSHKCVITFAVHLVWRSWLPTDRRCLILMVECWKENLLSLFSLYWTSSKTVAVIAWQFLFLYRNAWAGVIFFMVFMSKGWGKNSNCVAESLVYIHNAIFLHGMDHSLGTAWCEKFQRNYAQPIC